MLVLGMQDAIAILISIAAGVFLARRGWQRLARRGAIACESCLKCGSSGSRQLVSILTNVSPAKPQRLDDISR